MNDNEYGGLKIPGAVHTSEAEAELNETVDKLIAETDNPTFAASLRLQKAIQPPFVRWVKAEANTIKGKEFVDAVTHVLASIAAETAFNACSDKSQETVEKVAFMVTKDIAYGIKAHIESLYSNNGDCIHLSNIKLHDDA